MQCDDVDLAEVDVVHEAGRSIAVPGHPDCPFAALVGFVEFYVDTISVLQGAADLVIGPIIIVGRIDADKIDPVTSCIDECDVALVCGVSRTHQSSSRQYRKKHAAHRSSSSVAGFHFANPLC